MKESSIRDFFLNRLPAASLICEAPKPPTALDKASSRSIAIDDLNSRFQVTREMAASLCDAALSGQTPAWVVGTVARTLFASKHFTWEDPVLTEIFGGWSIFDGDGTLPHAALAAQKQELLRDAVSAPRRVSELIR